MEVVTVRHAFEVSKKFFDNAALKIRKKETRPADQALKESFLFFRAVKVSDADIYEPCAAIFCGQDCMEGLTRTSDQVAAVHAAREIFPQCRSDFITKFPFVSIRFTGINSRAKMKTRGE